MKKFKFNVIFSLSFAALCTIFLYQNCSEQKYSKVNSSGISGALGSLDTTGGEIPIEVHVDNCADVQDLEKPICQKDIVLKLYAEADGKSVLVASASASPKVVQDNGVDAVKYFGIFKVAPADLQCKTAVVKQESDAGEIEIARVKVDGPGCEETTDGTFSIDNLVQLGRLFEASGKCVGSSAISFSGTIDDNASKQAACSSSKFSYCSYSKKLGGLNNNIVGTQASKTDSRTFAGKGAASVFITIDESQFNPATSPLMVSGRCTPNGDISLSIYGNVVKNKEGAKVIKCTSSGTWVFNGNVLVPSLTDRRLDVSISHALGTMNIYTNIDLTTAPNAKITSTASNSSICKNVAGTVAGTCRTGLPIELKVNDKATDLKLCEGGIFKFENVLLHSLGSSNKLSVHQIQTAPNGLEVPGSDSKSITTF